MDSELKNKIIIKGGANSIDIDPPIHTMFKNDLISKVINTWKQIAPAYITKQIYASNSVEGGFALDITPEWVVNLGGTALQYRELNFVIQNNHIVDLKYPYDIVSWSSEEIVFLLNIIDNIRSGLTNTNYNFEIPTVTDFYFSNAIPMNLIVEFTLRVLDQAKRTSLLRYIDQNYSELGFQLPMDQNWLALAFNFPKIKLYQFRQLIYIGNNQYVMGIRLKDSIPFWTTHELELLIQICESVIRSMNLPLIPVNYLLIKSGLESLYNLKSEMSNTISKYKHHKIKFDTYINLDKKDEFMIKVAKMAKKTKILKKLELSFSNEGGFTLPMTGEWEKYLDDDIEERELEFIIDGNKIKGLRFTEGISVWSKDEVEELLEIIDFIADTLKQKPKKLKKSKK